MRKKAFLLTLILLFTYTVSFAGDINIEGEAVLLMDYDTKEILYEKNMDLKLYPASTTKIITAILALELGKPDDVVTVDQEVVNLTEGSHIALETGEQLYLEQMLYALMIPSANDAALAIGKHISGSLDDFVDLMNEKAKEIGATNTHFVNPNGLHDDNHYSTAYDIALISHYAMENETFREIVNTNTYEIAPTNVKGETRYLHNTNRLLENSGKINVDGNIIPSKYQGVSGIKTGTTGQAGYCLVSYAERDGQRLLAVVLKSSANGVYADSHKLLDYGFNNFDNLAIGFQNEFIENIEIENGTQSYVAGVLKNDFIYPMSNESLEKIDVKVNLRDRIIAPINKGDLLGNAEYYLDGNLIGAEEIISTMDVEIDPMSKMPNKILSKWYIFVFAGLIFIRVAVIRKRKRRRSRGRTYSMPYEMK